VLDLFDQYVHDGISRREFLEKVGKLTLGGLSAAAILASLSPQYALANQVPESDDAIDTGYITYKSENGYGSVKAYLAKPKKMNGKRAAVLVVHENRGLNPYIEDVARRVAKAGFIGLAPDGLTSLGGYPGTDDDGREMQRKLDGAKLLEDFIAGVDYLKSLPDCTGKIGAVGFCYGGGVCNQLAVRIPDLAASVPYYGRQPASEDVQKINAALLIHYAGLDQRVNAGWPDYENELKAQKKEYQAFIYPDVNHGFHNDTTPRYDKEAAELSWKRTIDFFNQKLK
ncbi:MAG: dienelactone hydrolase family protein, partial [Calditrichaeota bacterium]|nr:dienelactone hydrolase family protein [Calditrichota bacterium]